MKPYYFTLDGKSAVGPTSLAQIESDIKAGLLPSETKISDEHLAEWFTLEDWLEHEKLAPENVATRLKRAHRPMTAKPAPWEAWQTASLNLLAWSVSRAFA